MFFRWGLGGGAYKSQGSDSAAGKLPPRLACPASPGVRQASAGSRRIHRVAMNQVHGAFLPGIPRASTALHWVPHSLVPRVNGSLCPLPRIQKLNGTLQSARVSEEKTDRLHENQLGSCGVDRRSSSRLREQAFRCEKTPGGYAARSSPLSSAPSSARSRPLALLLLRITAARTRASRSVAATTKSALAPLSSKSPKSLRSDLFMPRTTWLATTSAAAPLEIPSDISTSSARLRAGNSATATPVAKPTTSPFPPRDWPAPPPSGRC